MINPIGVPPLGARPLQAAAPTAAVTGVERRRRPCIARASRWFRRIGGPLEPGADRARRAAAGPAAARRAPVRPRRRAILLSRRPGGGADRARARPAAVDQGARRGHPRIGARKAYALRQMLAAAEQAAGLLAVSEALARRHGRARLAAREDHRALHRARPRAVPAARSRTTAARGWPRIRLEFPPRAACWSTVGALIPRKGQPLVIRALARLPDDAPRCWSAPGAGPRRALRELWRARRPGATACISSARSTTICCRSCCRRPMRWCCPRPAKGSPMPGSRRSPAAARW